MFLVRLIDVFVGVLEFIFKSDKRGQGASPAVLGTAGIITLVALRAAGHRPAAVALSGADQLLLGRTRQRRRADHRRPDVIAGVPAGRIESIRLAGDVRVEFRLDRKQPLGDQTRAAMRLRTVLGKRFFEVVPAGRASANHTIPLARTDSPYTLDDVSSDAVRSSDRVDRAVVRAMLTAMESMGSQSG